MDGKFFTDSTKDLIVKVGDDAIEGGILVELVDGPGVRALVNIIDHYADKIIPDEYDSKINLLAALALSGDYAEAIIAAEDLALEVAKLEIENDTVKRVVISGLTMVFGLIQDFAEKKMAE